MTRLRDLQGQPFGRLTVIERDNTATDCVKWICQCTCGGTKSIYGSALIKGLTHSCGCLSRESLSMRTLKDITGERYGRLVVSHRDPEDPIQRGAASWVCFCDCGKQTIVVGANLRKGLTTSCGCFFLEIMRDDLDGQRFSRLVVQCSVPSVSGKKRAWLCQCDCGNECVVSGASLRRRYTRSCGCLVKINHPRGNNHPMWREDLTEEDRTDRRLDPRNKAWVSEVLARDNYTCQVCAVRGGKLVAHHKNAFHWCIEQRYDLQNGTTLCHTCHKAFHDLYGLRNTTVQQYIEFTRR